MKSNIDHPAGSNNDLSMREIILNVIEWKNYLKRKFLIIALCGLIGAGIGFLYAIIEKPNYQGSLTFILEESKSNPLGSYAGIASQFGIDLGAGGGSGVFAGDNILEFLKSRLMIEKALLTPVKTGNNQTMSLADHYIETEGLRKKWDSRSRLKNVTIPANLPREKFSLLQDSILNVVQLRIVKKNLNVSKPDKKLSFILVNCITNSEIFAKIFTERLVSEATDFYVATKTQRTKVNVDKLQFRADSIERLLNRKTFSAAAEEDLNLNPARKIAMVSSELVARDKIVLQTIYGEVIKNLEIAKMTMAQETPIIQIVDTPIFPLERIKLGKLKGLILGGILGGMLVVFALILLRMYRKTMSN